LKSEEIQKALRPRITTINRSKVKKNPLKNPVVMRKLNPYAAVMKKYARTNNERRRAARDVLRKRRNGEKVTDSDVKKAALTLGVKVRKYKEYKAEIQKKKATIKAIRDKVAAIQAKRAEKAKK